MFSLRTLGRATLAVAVSAASLTGSADAAHRARLGSDLERDLARGSQSIDVIVHGSRADIEALARRYNLRVRRQLKSGAVLGVTAGQLDALASDANVDHLSADAVVRSSGITTEAIGADQVWAGVGRLKPVSGRGIGVAVIDSGMDTHHAALAGRVVFTKDFIGGDGGDPWGHGTHVGALIAGGAGATADTSDYQGVAPAARLINLRVLDGTGAGKASDVIDAIDWAIDNQRRFNIRVINLSLGAPVVQSYKDDPLCEAVERAVAAGIVVVSAAGNYGVTKDGSLVFGSVTSPGNDPLALTVGAVDMHDTPQRSDDTVAKYSSKGPTLFDLVLKPDLVAPGSRLVSAEAAGSYLAATHPERHIAGSGANAYMALSGTSMAAGVTSGAVALLLDRRPQLTPAEVKFSLQLTSSLISNEGLLTSGAGLLNVASAALFVGARPSVSSIQIAGETVRAGGIAFIDGSTGQGSKRTELRLDGSTIVWGGGTELKGNTIVWGGAADTIIWGGTNDTIVWGGTTETIVWGNTIVWGSLADTIVWGGTADTIVWGGTIVWGSAASTIIWGGHVDASTIVWGGTVSGSTIVWGGSVGGNTIVWGGGIDGNTIVWGGNVDSSTIVWGSVFETIVWGS